MQLDIQQIINNLGKKLADKEVENTLLNVQLDELQRRYNALLEENANLKGELQRINDSSGKSSQQNQN